MLEVDPAAIESVYNYWKLKRRAGNNRPLLPPRSDEGDLLCKRQEQQDLDKMRMFVQLRQDLERVSVAFNFFWGEGKPASIIFILFFYINFRSVKNLFNLRRCRLFKTYKS